MKKLAIILLALSVSLGYSQSYEEVAKEIGIGKHQILDSREMSGGVVAFDFNNDGWEDIFVVGGAGNPCGLYQNMKNGKFQNIYASSGIYIEALEHTVGAAAADLDNDGDKDLIVTTNERANTYIFENIGNGKFLNITKSTGIEGNVWNTAVSFIDFDLDGDLDIYLSSYIGSNGGCDRNFFYENLGNMKFKEIGIELGVDDIGCSLASTFSDYDGDGDFDLLVANDFGKTVSSNRLFENLYPEKKFKDATETSGFNSRIFGMGIEGGDFDEDGDMDYYTTNIGENHFFVNNGNKTMTEKGVQYGIDNKHKAGTDSLATSWGIAWYDYDNDSHLDLFVSNGNVILTDSLMSFTDPNLLFHNDGQGNFTEVGEAEGIADTKKGRGIALVDFDNDGDMDIVQTVATTGYGSQSETDDDRVHFFKNNASENGNNWIQFHLVGNSDNRDAIGSKVAIFFDGRKLIAETSSGGSSYMSMKTSIIHFGLGAKTSIDRVEVTFPNGEKAIKYNLKSKQRYDIIQAYRTTTNVELCYGDRFNNKFDVYRDTTVSETYTAKNGVDSIVTYQIEVDAEIKINANSQLCYGDEFQGFTWKSAGQVTEKLKSYKGCDSTIIHNITVNPPVESFIDTTVCYGGLINKIRITKDRKVEIPIENPNGCDSLLVYNVVVNDGPKFTSNIDVCSGEMYKGVQITKDTILFSSFKTTTGCDSIYEESIAVLPYGQQDSTINLISDEMFEGKFYDKDTTIYRNLGFKASNGCDSLLAIHLNITLSSVSYDNSNLFDMKLYPNPAEDYIEISYYQTNAQQTTIELYNTMGQKVATIYNGYSAEGNNRKIWKFGDIHLPKGIYMLRITDKDKYRTEKLLIQ